MTKTPRMYSPERSDIYVFNFPIIGKVELQFLAVGEKGVLLFFNNTRQEQARPMSLKRFTYLLRFHLIDFCPHIMTGKVGLHRFENERRYTTAELDELIDDINDIKF